MAKPYSIFKAPTGVYYAQIRLPDGTRSNKKSTGSYVRSEAEKIVMGWVVNGSLPQRTNGKKQDEVTSVEKVTFFNNLKTYDFSDSDVDEIISILKKRKLIVSAVLPDTPESRSLEDYVEEFWDMEKSPYIKEKIIKGKEIHLQHVLCQIGRCRKYWFPRLKGKSVGEITRDDINAIYEDKAIMNLAPKSANEIVAALTLPLKWAYLHGLTSNNCYEGIIKRTNKVEKRKILTYEETKALFEAEWDNDMARLACLVACCTGMRQGEVAGLALGDIGEDRLYIRHSWNKYEGLKSTKTDEEREYIIPRLLRDLLLAQADLNPYNEGLKGFVFFGLLPGQPTDPKNWLKYMRRVLKNIGYLNPDEICFHSFRHEWCTTALTEIGDKRICMIGSGHKTDSVFANYSSHMEKEIALQTIAAKTEKLFMPLIESVEKVEYTVMEG